jgi:hypothetical protein
MSTQPKLKKNRAVSATVIAHPGSLGTFYMPQPFDKKDKFIPSSVDCAYNALYYSEDQVVQMLKAL